MSHPASTRSALVSLVVAAVLAILAARLSAQKPAPAPAPNPNAVVHDLTVKAQNGDLDQEAADTMRAKDPHAWAWAPTAGQIDQMPASELVGLKARADAQARSQP